MSDSESCSEHPYCRGLGYPEHIDACLKSMTNQELYDGINECCGLEVSACKSCPCWTMWAVLNKPERTTMPNGTRRIWFLQTKDADFGPNPFKQKKSGETEGLK